jgi:hypothetical protein
MPDTDIDGEKERLLAEDKVLKSSTGAKPWENKGQVWAKQATGSRITLRMCYGDTYVEQYLLQFQYTARLARWPKRDWGLHLAAALYKQARRLLQMDHLDPTGTRPSYTKRCARLRETFSPRGTEELWHQKAETYRKGTKESFVKMAQNVSEFTAKGIPPDVSRRQGACDHTSHHICFTTFWCTQEQAQDNSRGPWSPFCSCRTWTE